jgi:ABC-type Fe3+ transport system permease subunit
MQVITWMLYLTAIIVPPFFSTWRNSIYLAITNLAALIITQIFYEAYLVSVWCFFAALQSIMVLVVLREMRRKLKRNWKTWTTYLYDLKRRSAER